MRQDPVAVLELDPEHGIGQRLNHNSLNLNRLFLGHMTFPDNPPISNKSAQMAISPFQNPFS
jgi:hypothetical protein